MNVIILAAGYGIRLLPLTEHTPKSLLTVGGMPIIDHILDLLTPLPQIRNCTIVANDKFYGQFQDWKKRYTDSRSMHFALNIINDGTKCDKERRGPISDLVLALHDSHQDDDLLIIGGDNAFSLDFTKALSVRERKDANILGVHTFAGKQEVANKFGVVITDGDSRLTAFEEKPAEPASTTAATAIYLIRKQDVHHITELYHQPHTGEVNLGELIKYFLRKALPVYCIDVPVWFDIGTEADLKTAHEYFQNLARKNSAGTR